MLLPRQKEYRIWGGKKRIVKKIAIPGYVFISVEFSRRNEVFWVCGQNKMHYLFSDGKPCILKEAEVQFLKHLDENSITESAVRYDQLAEGTLVEITEGPFMGFRARVQSRSSHASLYLLLELSSSQRQEMPLLEILLGNVILQTQPVKIILE